MNSGTVYHARQQGMVLVICLIMLVLLTLSGIAAMQGGTLQERMAGNSRDAEQAFLAAEAALRNGEIFVLQTQDTDYSTAGTNGLYDVTASTALPVDWKDSDTLWRTGDTMGSSTAGDPNYLIEKLPEVINQGLSLAADQPLETMIIYRITARAVGTTDVSQAVLQSTFRR